jgi:hypothetical protein
MRQAGCETGYMTPKYEPRFISSRTDLYATPIHQMKNGPAEAPLLAQGPRLAPRRQWGADMQPRIERHLPQHGPAQGLGSATVHAEEGQSQMAGCLMTTNVHKSSMLWPPPFLNNLCHYCTS